MDQVGNAVPCAARLLPRGRCNAMNVAPQDAPAPLNHGVAEIDEGATRLRANVAPVGVDVLGLGGEELKAADDVEEHGHGADVRVAGQVLSMRDGLG